jgi:hypothetical protein
MKGKKKPEGIKPWKVLYTVGLVGFALGMALYTKTGILFERIPSFLPRANHSVTNVEIPPENSKQAFLAKYSNGCPAHKYGSVKIISRAPDIIAIEDFLTADEAEHLISFA